MEPLTKTQTCYSPYMDEVFTGNAWIFVLVCAMSVVLMASYGNHVCIHTTALLHWSWECSDDAPVAIIQNAHYKTAKLNVAVQIDYYSYDFVSLTITEGCRLSYWKSSTMKQPFAVNMIWITVHSPCSWLRKIIVLRLSWSSMLHAQIWDTFIYLATMM